MTAVTSAPRHAMGGEGEGGHTKSPSPATGRGFQAVNSAAKNPQDMRINTLLNNDEASHDGSPTSTTPAPVKKGPGRGNWRRNKNKADGTPTAGRTTSGEGSHHIPLLPNNGTTFVNETPGGGMPATPGSGYNSTFNQGSPNRNSALAFQPPNTGDHVPTPSYQAQKRSRGVTQHQNALINHRRQQIDYTLDRRIRKIHLRARDKREEEGALFRAWKRVKLMPADYDSEEEMIKSRKGRGGSADTKNDDVDWRRAAVKDAQLNGAAGDDSSSRPSRALLAGFVRVDTEASDLGEEAKALARSLRRCSRRLDRWQETSTPGQAVVVSRSRQREGLLYAQRPSVSFELEEDEDEAPPPPVVVRRRAPKGSGKRAAAAKAKAAKREEDEGAAMPLEDVQMEDDGGEDDGGGEGEGEGEGEGGGELDEEDRELLGEVDADESEEDEDETMADD